ncbi:membrane protein [Mycobacterium phage Estes]|uniref:Membrane protein n=1 Tax=Mycobacterium phage Estes TaxID=2759459 RepID=A0A7G9A2J9_9CAUD|nr:membrane protein [Mycobacterium phage Estes]QNL30838.1 membrane protein [Mycobacterium phage Estes]
MATTLVAQYKQEAVTFYRRWLIGSTIASIACNVAHSLFNPDNGTPWMAAFMSAVPPVVFALAIHGLGLMVKTQIDGAYFKAALAGTGAIGFVSLVLSFVALLQLSVEQGGMNIWYAWLWPLGLDLSVAVSTLNLLALTVGTRARREATAAVRTPAKKRAPKKVVKPKLVPMEVGA